MATKKKTTQSLIEQEQQEVIDFYYDQWRKGQIETLPDIKHPCPSDVFCPKGTPVCIWCGFDQGHDWACGVLMSYESWQSSTF